MKSNYLSRSEWGIPVKPKFLVGAGAVLFLSSTFAYGAEPSTSISNQVGNLSMFGVTAASALTPGITLLGVSYDIKSGKGHSLEWLGELNWLFWIIAAVDFVLDKFPVLASINQFFEHLIVWAIAYFISNGIIPVDEQTGENVMAMVGSCVAGSGILGVRQAITAAADGASAGIASPIRSSIEDVIGSLLAWKII